MDNCKDETPNAAGADAKPDAGDRRPTPSALRMRKLRARRRRLWTRVIPLEIDAKDCTALREHGFLVKGESALTNMPLALRRLLNSLRDTSPA